MTENLPLPRQVLAIGAHPDDVELNCGGTLAKWVANGCTVTHLICTDGSKGTWNPDVDGDELAARRRTEQIAASRALGGEGDVIFLDYVDGELQCTSEARDRIALAIRQTKPDVVLTHDPWRRYRLHPDHRAAGFLTTDAIVTARDPLFLRHALLPPHRPQTLLFFEADQRDHLEDVSPYVESKFAALLAHVSQLRSTMGFADEDGVGPLASADAAALRQRVTEELAQAAAGSGIGLAEAFKRLDDL